MSADWTKLERLAIEVAVLPPLKRNKYARCAGVPWSTIEALREEVTKYGIDWRDLHKQTHAIIQQRHEARRRG